MQKELEIAQVNELKFYLNWDYVKEICNDAIRKENEQLRKFLEEFNALDVAKENQQLKSLLKESAAYVKSVVMVANDCKEYEVAKKHNKLFMDICEAIGEKK